MKPTVLLVLMLACVTQRLGAQESDPQAASEAAIRKGVAAYAKAFNAGDSKALANRWTADAVYVNRITGEEVVGREAIAEQFEALFETQKDLKLQIDVASIQFLSPNVAVEHGTAKFIAPQAEPEEIEYTAVYLRDDGEWLLDRVTDQSPEKERSHYDQLKALEWMVGTWVDEDEAARIETDVHWAKNQYFLIRSFSVSVADRIEMSGMQIIGWDAAAKRICSWTFDSDGGFAEATWKQKDDRWFVSNQGVLADGRKATMVNVIKPVNENSFTWQTIERTVGGELLPNIAEVEMVRKIA